MLLSPIFINQNVFRALIEREDQNEAIRIDLSDNGAGSDLIANDGIYSKYFTRYDGFNGRYTFRCQVKGDDDTMFVTQKSGAKSVNSSKQGFIKQTFY